MTSEGLAGGPRLPGDAYDHLLPVVPTAYTAATDARKLWLLLIKDGFLRILIDKGAPMPPLSTTLVKLAMPEDQLIPDDILLQDLYTTSSTAGGSCASSCRITSS